MIDARDAVWQNGSDAQFRVWVRAILDGLLACGQVQTADTGQIDTATVVGPSAIPQYTGYAVFRFSDALQATRPIFYKLEFGTENGSQQPAFAITVGTGSDGAGNITGVFVPRQVLAAKTSDAVARPVWTCGDTNRIVQCAFRNGLVTGPTNMLWSIERTHGDDGADTATGALVVLWSYQIAAGDPGIPLYKAHRFDVVEAQTVAQGPPVSGNRDRTTTSGGDTGLIPWQMVSRAGAENPPINVMSYYSTDVAGDAIMDPVSVYGVNRKYRGLGAAPGGSAGSNGRISAAMFPVSPAGGVFEVNMSPAMRWD